MTEEAPEVKPTVEPVVEPSTTKEPKVESSEEVKLQNESADKLVKLEEQVGNLNVALKQERESRRTDSEKAKSLEEERKSLLETIDTLKPLADAMKPREPESEDPQVPAGLTADEVEEIFSKKQEEIRVKGEEEKRAELIQSEIKELSEKFDGKDGKPSYDDTKVLEWQKEQNKLYLTPKEAFYIMNQDTLIDHATKERLSKKSPTEIAETPAVNPGTHEPDVTPVGDIDTRKAIMEAMDNVEEEM